MYLLMLLICYVLIDPDNPTSATEAYTVSAPHLSKLWSFKCPLTKSRPVTCMAWNTVNKVMILLLLLFIYLFILFYFRIYLLLVMVDLTCLMKRTVAWSAAGP